MQEAERRAINDYAEFARVVIEELLPTKADSRFLLGITGSPAAGKSTFTEALVTNINTLAAEEIAVAVPMDGYHYSNQTLDQRNLLHLKGVPSSFDAEGYVQLIERIAQPSNDSHPQETSIFCPRFDRSIEASVENAIEIKPSHKIIVSEGNYLLLSSKPWDRLRQLFDQIWFIDVPLEELIPRLIARHEEGGRTPDQAQAKIKSTDLPNAQLVDAVKNRADRIISF